MRVIFKVPGWLGPPDHGGDRTFYMPKVIFEVPTHIGAFAIALGVVERCLDELAPELAAEIEALKAIANGLRYPGGPEPQFHDVLRAALAAMPQENMA